MKIFKVGSVVKLKSGSPAMTVRGDNGNSRLTIDCEWFYDGDVKSNDFYEEELSPANDQDN